jgi:ribosomal protein L31E
MSIVDDIGNRIYEPPAVKQLRESTKINTRSAINKSALKSTATTAVDVLRESVQVKTATAHSTVNQAVSQVPSQ